MPEMEIPAGRCFGVWTLNWARQVGKIPCEVQETLESLNHSQLTESISRHVCPFGYGLPGDVTWPEPPPELRDVVATLTSLKVACVVWSYLPYAVAGYAVSIFFIQRGTRQLYVLTWIVFYVLFNELVIKKLVQDPRPGTLLEVRSYDDGGKLAGSCVASCGMPSSHAGLTSGLFLLIFLDASFRVRPKNKRKRKRKAAGMAGPGRFMKWLCRAFKCVALPWVSRSTFTHQQFVWYVCYWFAILVPASTARVMLKDHSTRQVLFGQFIGSVAAMTWWCIVRRLQHCFESRVDKKFCYGLLQHNFPLQDIDHNESEREDEEQEVSWTDSSPQSSSDSDTRAGSDC